MYKLITDAAFWVAVLGLISFVVRKIWEDWSINKAVQAEIDRLMEVIRRHRDFWQECVANGTTSHHPLIPFRHVVYDKQVKNLGVIYGGKVDAVVRFYGYVDYLNDLQLLRKHYDNSENSSEFNEMYIGTLSRMLGLFKSTFPVSKEI